MNWFVLTVFVLLPVVGSALGVRNWLLFRHGVRVSGRIVGHERIEPMSGSEAIHFPVVEFRDTSGRMLRKTMSAESPHRGDDANALGATVKLVYPRGHPTRARYHERMLYLVAPALCFAPALAIALFIAVSVAWYRLFG